MRRTVLSSWVVVVSLAGAWANGSRAASVYDDTFSDGVAGPQWTTVIDDPARLNLIERAGSPTGRLDLVAGGGGSINNDALYLSNFRLSTASDFRARLDYSFTGYTTAGPADTAIGLAFGVGRDLEGTDAAAIGQGFGTRNVTIGPFTLPVTAAAGVVGGRTDDVPFGGTPDPATPTTGTWEIVYDAAGDALTLQRVGGGVSLTLNDTVRGVWGATDLLVSFGGRGEGFVTTSTPAAGQAFLSNFRIDYGTVVPEPAGTAMAVVGLLGVAVRRRRR